MNSQEIVIKLSLSDLDKIREQVASKQRDIDALQDIVSGLRHEIARLEKPGCLSEDKTVAITASQFWEAVKEIQGTLCSLNNFYVDPAVLAQKLGLEGKP
jgi:hypothetical protein